jgi:arsenite oxidase large subunit
MWWNLLKPDPNANEFWLTNGRIEEIWQTMYTDLRKPEIVERWPSNVVEIHPDDAAKLGLKSGDAVSVTSTRVARKEAGQYDAGSFTAVAYVSDIVPPGVLWTNFAYPDQWCNSVAPRIMHPANPVPPYKLARATITRLGSTELAQQITFAPRNLPPKSG